MTRTSYQHEHQQHQLCLQRCVAFCYCPRAISMPLLITYLWHPLVTCLTALTCLPTICTSLVRSAVRCGAHLVHPAACHHPLSYLALAGLLGSPIRLLVSAQSSARVYPHPSYPIDACKVPFPSFPSAHACLQPCWVSCRARTRAAAAAAAVPRPIAVVPKQTRLFPRPSQIAAAEGHGQRKRVTSDLDTLTPAPRLTMLSHRTAGVAVRSSQRPDQPRLGIDRLVSSALKFPQQEAQMGGGH